MTCVALGFFVFGAASVCAALPLEHARELVERYALERYGTSTRPFFIDPTVLTVNDGAGVPAQTPTIIGLAPNHTTLQIFIDDLLVGSVSVNEPAGQVAMFSYQLQWLVAQETHAVYVQAVNSRGVLSKPSSRFYFSVNDALVPQISATRIERAGPVDSEMTAPAPLLQMQNTDLLALATVVAARRGGVNKVEVLLSGVIIALLVAWLWRGRGRWMMS